MDTIDRAELQQLVETGRGRVVLTLGPLAYARAHIPGSETFADVGSALEQLPRDADIVVYDSGAACSSSRRALRVLRSRGYDRVRRYAGGLEDWQGAGLPLACTA